MIEVDEKTIDKFLKKIDRVKRNNQYQNTLLNACQEIEPLLPVIEKKIPSVIDLFHRIIKVGSGRNHHLPNIKVLNNLSRQLSEVLVYVKTDLEDDLQSYK